MIIDSSVLVAIALSEPDWMLLAERIHVGAAYVPSPTFLESYMVLKSRVGNQADELLNKVMSNHQIEIVPFEIHHASTARSAFDRFGKGRHPASLNFGDCIVYAVAKSSNQPLLFVGNDFSQTDIVPA